MIKLLDVVKIVLASPVLLLVGVIVVMGISESQLTRYCNSIQNGTEYSRALESAENTWFTKVTSHSEGKILVANFFPFISDCTVEFIDSKSTNTKIYID